MLRRRRAVLGQRVAARYPWPLENEAAVRLGRESAAQSPLHRSLGSGGEGSVEGFYPGNVGGQALTGIAALEELRHRNDVDVQIWPFETLGEGRSHVLAEIYPSLIEPCPGDEVLDARQVKAVALALQELDRLGELKRYLRAPNEMPAHVISEEGLILGVQDREGFWAVAARVTPSC